LRVPLKLAELLFNLFLFSFADDESQDEKRYSTVISTGSDHEIEAVQENNENCATHNGDVSASRLFNGTQTVSSPMANAAMTELLYPKSMSVADPSIVDHTKLKHIGELPRPGYINPREVTSRKSNVTGVKDNTRSPIHCDIVEYI
jgi:hypothetical protein